MAGKSTFLRQNALIAILAQTGSFVPAKAAHIGVVDRLFSRVGAADDLARGRSTFMVEMVETAAILNQAGPRSLVILDEIGRGTATFDGLSIAWATVEHLHDVNKCRALFATHFHELTALAARLDRLHNATVRVKEWQGDVVFLHEVVPGSADRSYGIQVAKLAGLPASVIERAKLVLAKLEQEDRAEPKGFEDLPLFAAPYKPSQQLQDDALRAGGRRGRRAQSRRHVAARGDGSALYAEGEAGGDGEERNAMMNIAERKHVTAPADAQSWLERFAAALQAQDAAAAAELFLADGLWRDVLAFTWNIADHGRQAGDRGDAAPDACPHQAGEFPYSAETNAAALGQPRRHRDASRPSSNSRPRSAPPTASCAWCPTPSAVAAARLDAAHDLAGTAGPRRGFQEARGARGRQHARLRRRQLARPPQQGARLCRSRPCGHRGRRRPGRALDRGAAAAARRRYADRRPARSASATIGASAIIR